LYPHRDSRLTMIRESTREILAVGAGVPGVSEEKLTNVLRELSRLLGKIGWNCSSIVLLE
jgi:DNA/RNA-binding domain of Phe-tRNA-synthetase-like protein